MGDMELNLLHEYRPVHHYHTWIRDDLKQSEAVEPLQLSVHGLVFPGSTHLPRQYITHFVGKEFQSRPVHESEILFSIVDEFVIEYNFVNVDVVHKIIQASIVLLGLALY